MGCYSNILGSRQKSLLDSSALATLEMHLASCQADIDKEVARVGESGGGHMVLLGSGDGELRLAVVQPLTKGREGRGQVQRDALQIKVWASMK